MMEFKRLDASARVPTRATQLSAAYDLYALENTVLECNKVVKVRTGIAVQLPLGTCGLIKSRSSLALRGCEVLGGVIDADYRGELMVIINVVGGDSIAVNAGDRIAQLVPVQLYIGATREVAEFSRPEGDRVGGFGSTGK